MSSLFDHELGQVIDNTSALLNRIASLYDSEDLSDIELAVSTGNPDEKWIFRAHKLVLCTSSDVLRVMLLNPMWPDSQRAHVQLEEQPECAGVC